MSPSDSSRLNTLAKCSSTTAYSRAAPTMKLNAGPETAATSLRRHPGSFSVPSAHS